MDTLVMGLGPAFAAGFGTQRLLEILDPVLSNFLNESNKKVGLAIISFIFGLVLAVVAGLRVLKPLGMPDVPYAADVFLTGLIVSGGTEGFNSIMKFLGYAKDQKKSDAAVQEAVTTPAARKAVDKR